MNMRCPNCGEEFTGTFCSNCGRPAQPQRFCPQCGSRASGHYCSFCGTRIPSSAEAPFIDYSDKRKWPAFFLCLFLGGLGLHRFYVGKIGTGILMLLLFVFAPGLGVLAALVDLILIVMGKFRDKRGWYLR